MIRELSRKEKQEYDNLTKYCRQITLAELTGNPEYKNLPVSESIAKQKDLCFTPRNAP
ncbi:MAG: hypothetical protein J5959_13100 [Butyrivibrio sp.]|nr:hypothetical protein [Butyrivibrio sp.]